MKKAIFFVLIASICLVGNSQIIKSTMPDKLVVLTFDDATASQYSNVAPLLQKYGFGGTFFICEFPPNFSDTSKYMDWGKIKQLDNMGFEIANHTRSHPILPRLTREQIDKQLGYIDNKCDSMNIAKPATFAYPGYGLDSTVVEIIKSKGFKFARAGGNRPYDPLNDNPLLVPSWAMTANNKTQIMEAFAEAHDGKVVVITIHGVPDVEHPWVTTPLELFTEYLQYLSDNNYTVIAFRDLDKYINHDYAFKIVKPDFTKILRN